MTQPALSHFPHAVDPLDFRAAIGSFATGVAVVTAKSEGVCYGMTVNSLTSVSLNPCLLLVCPRHGSATGEAMKQSRVFAVNILAKSQHALANRFVSQAVNRFEGVATELSQHGAPLLKDALSQFECLVRDVHPAGDHDIVVGQVVACSRFEGDPLVFFRGGFGHYHSANDH
jgi:3-hydroxy-9,10-secoandrosta-1,3,5(10)-triene-9,17-dione monooxygenase reductase component